MDTAHAAPGSYRFAPPALRFYLPGGPTAGVTGKGGMWRTKPPDAESAVGAASPKVRRNARTCPVHAMLGAVYIGRLSTQAQVAGTGGATRLRNSTVLISLIRHPFSTVKRVCNSSIEIWRGTFGTGNSIANSCR